MKWKPVSSQSHELSYVQHMAVVAVSWGWYGHEGWLS